jgi:hypothetical protein
VSWTRLDDGAIASEIAKTSVQGRYHIPAAGRIKPIRHFRRPSAALDPDGSTCQLSMRTSLSGVGHVPANTPVFPRSMPRSADLHPDMLNHLRGLYFCAIGFACFLCLELALTGSKQLRQSSTVLRLQAIPAIDSLTGQQTWQFQSSRVPSTQPKSASIWLHEEFSASSHQSWFFPKQPPVASSLSVRLEFTSNDKEQFTDDDKSAAAQAFAQVYAQLLTQQTFAPHVTAPTASQMLELFKTQKATFRFLSIRSLLVMFAERMLSVAVLWAVLWAWLRFVQMYPDPIKGRCSKCGYNVADLPRCPECGRKNTHPQSAQV